MAVNHDEESTKGVKDACLDVGTGVVALSAGLAAPPLGPVAAAVAGASAPALKLSYSRQTGCCQRQTFQRVGAVAVDGCRATLSPSRSRSLNYWASPGRRSVSCSGKTCATSRSQVER